MSRVVFVAPFLLEATVRFVRAVADLPGVRVGVVSQDPPDRLPPSVASRIAAYERVDDALDVDRIEAAARTLAGRLGGIDRLLGTLEQVQVALATVRERLRLVGMRSEAAKNFRDKARMKDVLRAAGLPCARHRLVDSLAEAKAFAREIGFPIVVKPPEGAGAKGTFRADDEPALDRAVGALSPASGRPVLLEEYVTGVEHSFDTASIRGRPVWHSVSRYMPSPLEVLRNPWIQWCVLVPREVEDPRYDDVRRIAFRALEVLGMGTGVSHMEWFRRADGGICLSEVGARPPGAQFCSLLSYANDVDFYASWARLVVHEEFEPPSRLYAAGAAYLRGQGAGRVVGVEGVERVLADIGPLVVEAHMPQRGQAPSGTYEGDGYVILRHPETAVVEAALGRLVSNVRVVLG